MNNNNKEEHLLTPSGSIRQEIQRFEKVHPNIYAIYELIEQLDDGIQEEIRNHVICIEDAFVNSQEWTISRNVSEIRIGLLGGQSSGKSSLVHRYLTGAYCDEDSPEGGRFKKDVVIEGKTNLLLLRDEGGPPQQQFSTWLDALVMVFSLTDVTSFQTLFTYYKKMKQFRDVTNIPIIVVGTQDKISATNPRLITDDEAKKFTNNIKCNQGRSVEYIETCATYGLNVDQVFTQISRDVILQRQHRNIGGGFQPQYRSISSVDTSNIMTSTPVHNNHIHSDGDSNSNFFTPNQSRKSLRNLHHSKSSKSSKIHRKASDGDDKKRNSSSNSTSIMTSQWQMGFGRDIPIKQGYLMKKTKNKHGRGIGRAEWKKKFVALDQNGHISYYNNINDYMDNQHKQTVHVMQTTIKLPGKHSSIMINPSLQSTSSNHINTSTSNTTLNDSSQNSHTNNHTPTTTMSGTNNSNSGDDEFQIVLINGQCWHFQATSTNERDEWIQQIQQIFISSLQNQTNSNHHLQQKPTPDNCVECGDTKASWASLNHGVVICIKCSGIHRKLGTHISRVRSLELDDWPEEYNGIIKRIGNQISQNIWEYNVGDNKITSNSSKEDREKFIRDKYEKRKYLAPLPPKYQLDLTGAIIRAINESDSKTFLLLLAHSTPEDINKTVGQDMRTPLHAACFVGDLSFCQLLLWTKADASIKDAAGETPLAICTRQHHFECVRILKLESSCMTSSASMTSSKIQSTSTSSIQYSSFEHSRGQKNSTKTQENSPNVESHLTPSRSPAAPKLNRSHNLMFTSAI